MIHNVHHDLRRFRRLLGYARRYSGRLAGGMLMLALVSLLEPVISIAFSRILDRAFVYGAAGDAAGLTSPQSALARSFLAPLSNALDQLPILWFPILLVAVFAVRGVANFLGDLALHWVASRVVFDLRREIFTHLLRMPVSFFDGNAAAELTSKVTYDIQQVGVVTSQALTTLVQDTLKLVVALALMASISFKLTMGVFIIAPIVAIIVRLVTKRLRAASVALQAQMGELTRFTDESLSNQRSIKIYNAFTQMGEAFFARANRVRQSIMKQEGANAASAPLVHLVVSLAIAGVVTLAIQEGQRGLLTAGDFFVFFTALLSLLPPLKSLSSINAVLQRGLAAASSVFSVLDMPVEMGAPLKRSVGQASLAVTATRVRFSNVGFCYAGRDKDALRDVTLDIKPGQHVAFVGASGSGKSTALALLSGFYLPDSGDITIDDELLSAHTTTSLRERVALVAQDVLLINDSITRNIAFGVNADQIDHMRVRWAAEACGAATFISAIPGNYDALVGEGGSLLSGGQRQRISIARALYKRAPLILFDEATSALDSESERIVQDTLKLLGRDHTVIQVAHRLSSVRDADQIYVFSEGRVAEQGKHHDLLNQHGHYARLLAAQMD